MFKTHMMSWPDSLAGGYCLHHMQIDLCVCVWECVWFVSYIISYQVKVCFSFSALKIIFPSEPNEHTEKAFSWSWGWKEKKSEKKSPLRKARRWMILRQDRGDYWPLQASGCSVFSNRIIIPLQSVSLCLAATNRSKSCQSFCLLISLYKPLKWAKE